VSINKYSTERINLNLDYNKNWRFLFVDKNTKTTSRGLFSRFLPGHEDSTRESRG
jgi:hypothetical protein